MAKKTVASLHEGSKEGRAYTKVIKTGNRRGDCAPMAILKLVD